MTDKKMLEKAIQKAINNGWGNVEGISLIRYYSGVYTEENELVKTIANFHEDMHMNSLIFNHDFAKALWKDMKFPYDENYGDYTDPLETWQYHLQQMVISESPIEYLGENI